MRRLQFRISGLNRRWWQRATRATSTKPTAATTPKLVVVIVCVCIWPINYAINHPHKFEITLPKSGSTTQPAVVVEGTVGNERVRTVLLEVNGSSRVVPVKQRKFTSGVDLRQGSHVGPSLPKANGFSTPSPRCRLAKRYQFGAGLAMLGDDDFRCGIFP